MEHTDVEELKGLNLLGVQFALCECSKWLFYLRYDSGSIYRPSSRDFELALQEVKEVEAARLQAIWMHTGREFSFSGFLFSRPWAQPVLSSSIFHKGTGRRTTRPMRRRRWRTSFTRTTE